ncbi:hypothetical protein HYW99_01825 [Candidatus Woesearchaeota archaeon]|nr:hypothetical protein [Candidatus Woesearchaeota archaeon]
MALDKLLQRKTYIFIYKDFFCVVEMETVTIPKEEYERLKKLEQLDFDLIRQFASSLEDLKRGRFKRLA